MTESDDERLISLQVRFAEQEAQLNELSDVVAEQWREIDSLKRRLRTFEPRLETLEAESSPKSQADERPPHY